MRALSALGALTIVAALTMGVTIAHLHAQDNRLVAPRPAAATPASAYDIPDPVTRMIPRPTPTPAPVQPAASQPTTAPPAASRPTVSAPVAVRRVPAPPRIVVESAQQSLINQDRARSGLAPLTWSSCLYNVALANARRMAAQEYISHTNGVYQDLACGLGHRSGENVGYYSAGISDPVINTAFMNSAEHRANILGPYHYVATAWVVGANGYGYIAVEFD